MRISFSLVLILLTASIVGCNPKTKTTWTFAPGDSSEESDALHDELERGLADGSIEVIEVPLSAVPHHVCDAVVDGDSKGRA